MEGVEHLYPIEIGESVVVGKARFSKIEVLPLKALNYNIRNSSGAIFKMEPGKYIQLFVDNELVMSDTRMEKLTNQKFIDNAKGDVIIAGLGIGMIIHNLREKMAEGTVKSITVIEVEQDVIDYVSPLFEDMNITYIVADVMEYKPPRGVKYDTIYFDIWPAIGEDNILDMAVLHKRWKSCKSKDGWMSSWLHRKIKGMISRGVY